MKNPSMPGYLMGWVNFVEMEPLRDGQRYPQPAVVDYAQQRTIQEWFERGYRQIAVQRAICNTQHQNVRPDTESSKRIFLSARTP